MSKPRLPVIIVTAYGDSDHTIPAMRDGAFEYVTKPFDIPKLLAALARAVKDLAPASLPAADTEASALIGSSATMLDIWKQIGRAAASDVAVFRLRSRERALRGRERLCRTRSPRCTREALHWRSANAS